MAREIRYTTAGQGKPAAYSNLYVDPLPPPGKPLVYRAIAFENGQASQMKSFVVGHLNYNDQPVVGAHLMQTLFKFQQNLPAWYDEYEKYFNLIWLHAEVANDDVQLFKSFVESHEKYAKRSKFVLGVSFGGTQEQVKIMLDLAFNSKSAMRTDGKVWLTAWQFNSELTSVMKYYVKAAGYDWNNIIWVPNGTYKRNEGDGTQVGLSMTTAPMNQEMSDLLFEEYELDGHFGFNPSLSAIPFQQATANRLNKLILPAVMHDYSSIEYHNFGMQYIIDTLELLVKPKREDRLPGCLFITPNDIIENTALMPFNDIGIEGLSSLVAEQFGYYLGQSLNMRIPYATQIGILKMAKVYNDAIINKQENPEFKGIRVFASHMLHYSNAEPRKTPHKLFLSHSPQLVELWPYTVAANPLQYKQTANLRYNHDDTISICVQLEQPGYKLRYGSWTSDVLPAGSSVFKRPVVGYGNQKITILKGSKIVWTGYTGLPVEIDPSMGQWGLYVDEVNETGLPYADAPKWSYDKFSKKLYLIGSKAMEFQDDHDKWQDYTGPIDITESKREQNYKGRTKASATENASYVVFSPAIK